MVVFVKILAGLVFSAFIFHVADSTIPPPTAIGRCALIIPIGLKWTISSPPRHCLAKLFLNYSVAFLSIINVLQAHLAAARLGWIPTFFPSVGLCEARSNFSDNPRPLLAASHAKCIKGNGIFMSVTRDWWLLPPPATPPPVC